MRTGAFYITSNNIIYLVDGFTLQILEIVYQSKDEIKAVDYDQESEILAIGYSREGFTTIFYSIDNHTIPNHSES